MSADKVAPIKVHAAIAKALIDNGVDTIFGVAGDANMFIVDSFVREFKGNYVAAANEAGATLMAIGYANASGKVGVVTVTHGPAVTNTLTALVEGVKGQTSLLLLCGDTAVEDKEHAQNIAQRDVILPTGAGFEQLRSPRTVSLDLATALRRAIFERRPIALNVPIDFQWEDVAYEPVTFKLPEMRALVPASADLDDAVGIIATAKRPILLAGRGAMHAEARQALLRLAERTGALLATTLRAKDLFRGEAFNLGLFGTLSTPVAVDLIAQSDCIMAFGASLNKLTSDQGALLKGKRVVQCNLEAAEIGKHARPTAGLVGDPGLVADAIIRWLDEAEVVASGFRSDEIERRIKAYSPAADGKDLSTATTIDMRKALMRLDAAVPPDRVFVTDGGRFTMEPWRLVGVRDPRLFLYPINFGSIGLGMSVAIGASFAAPGKPVFHVTGDGGFMLGGLAEFNTAVRHKVDLIVVVCNDGSYGAEHFQFRMRQMDPGLSLFNWPEFASVATALGGHGITVRTSEDLERAAQAIKDRDRPLLIDLKCDPDRMPDIEHYYHVAMKSGL
jgi:thiamine pyrophosphate-dependent acetolactate synthase large subunit-like protein